MEPGVLPLVRFDKLNPYVYLVLLYDHALADLLSYLAAVNLSEDI